MLVVCPHCRKTLRLGRDQAGAQSLRVRCPGCAQPFRVRAPETCTATALIAHPDKNVVNKLKAGLQRLDCPVAFCRDAQQVLDLLHAPTVQVLLLDVAFSGCFPFSLLQEAARCRVKVVLLPAVFKRTAYKKNPPSLYGADGYLELHHIDDQLSPLMMKLVPGLRLRTPQGAEQGTALGERRLPQAGLQVQAEELARLLVADIAFYHEEELVRGGAEGRLAEDLEAALQDGRRLLIERVPAVAGQSHDFIGVAFLALCEEYRRTHPGANSA